MYSNSPPAPGVKPSSNGTPLETARGLLAAGISYLPVARDGSKKPWTNLLPQVWNQDTGKFDRKWKPLQGRLPTQEETRDWYDRPGPPGIATICGAVSGNLELLDFDREAADVFPRWRNLVGEEAPRLVERLNVTRTPRLPAGYHVRYRCREVPIPGNDKLATDPDASPDDCTLVETRGEGGYALAPGCPPDCHESGRLYEHACGPLITNLSDITAEERELLIRCARYFDRQRREQDRLPSNTNGCDLRPGDDFDRRGPDWSEILERHGWTCVATLGQERRWRRPGKEGRCWSATTGHCTGKNGEDLFMVFSSNAEPFQINKPYGKFRAVALLDHHGDFKAAAKELARQGYGSQRGGAGAAIADTRSEIDLADVATIHDLVLAGASLLWLWEGWIQIGVPTVVASEAGCGKTRFVADLVRRIRRGLPWPDGAAMALPPDSRVLWVVADNHHAELVTLTHQFDIVENVLINASKKDPFGGTTLDSPEDLGMLLARIKAVKPAFTVIDTVGNSTDKDLCRQEEAKQFFQPLQVIARKGESPILGLTHLNLSGGVLGRRAMEKVRVAIRMEAPDPEDQPNRRKLAVIKSNAKSPPALGITMNDDGNEYDDKPPCKPDREPGRGPAPVKLEACVNWLRERLAEGKHRVSKVRSDAEAAGFSSGTLYKARDSLDVEETKLGGKLWWEMPEPSALSE
jgi:hypothetical protein